MTLYDIAYGIGMGLAAPYWLIVPSARRKVFKALHERMGHESARADDAPAVMIHAVSLGEINATRALVRGLSSARPGLEFIVSTTTDTGFSRGRELYGADPCVTLIRYPLDFSAAVRRVLDAQRPSLVVLMELEVWPNFVRECARRHIPVLLVNGRLTQTSFGNYRRVRPLVAPSFRRLAAVCAQEQAYAQRFVELGARVERVSVTGTMKFDTAQVATRIEGAEELAAAVGLRPGRERVWVCGSTGPGEERLILREYRRLLAAHPGLRLVIVPRKPERFDEAAELIAAQDFPVVRRSRPSVANQASPAPIVLGDTMGELRKFYSLADVVFVGRTLVDLGSRQHGSDMIEPAALARPVIVGPYTGNFAEVMTRFRDARAMMEVRDGPALGETVGRLLSDPAEAAAMGERAQEVVRAEQGATARHVELILRHLAGTSRPATGPLEEAHVKNC